MRYQFDEIIVDVIRSKRKTVSIQVLPNRCIVMKAPKYVSNTQLADIFAEHKESIQKILDNLPQDVLPPYSPQELTALAQKAATDIPQIARKYAQILGTTFGEITIRCQKTKYGSCSSNGNLNFNCLLADMPPEIMDYVVAHELCHRIEMNHSTRFYALLEQICPQHKSYSKWLKENGMRYICRVIK